MLPGLVAIRQADVEEDVAEGNTHQRIGIATSHMDREEVDMRPVT